MQRIVVGVDGSEASIAALRWAVELAGAVGAAIEVLRVRRYPPPYDEWSSYPTNYGYLPLVPGREPTTSTVPTDLTRGVRADHPAIRVTERLVEGHPGEVLVGASEHADLLVVGRRGHGGFAGLVLGSVARACSEHAHCPVVVVPADEPGPS